MKNIFNTKQYGLQEGISVINFTRYFSLKIYFPRIFFPCRTVFLWVLKLHFLSITIFYVSKLIIGTVLFINKVFVVILNSCQNKLMLSLSLRKYIMYRYAKEY